MSGSSVEQELFNIFSYYSLHGSPLDPSSLPAMQLIKLARDCQIVGHTPVTEADINVAYTVEVNRKNRTGIKKMNYSDFLTALMKISAKVYPDALSVDDSFQRLLMENVLPLASRRCPDAVDVFLEDEEVNKLFAYYADAMQQIFQFYASVGDIKAKARASTRTGTRRRPTNSMKDAMGYSEYLKFASDFNLSSVLLSTLEIGDIYLSSVKATDGIIRKLTFREFKEALVRCALVAYSKISDASIIDKISGLFLYMWRAINKSVPRAFDHRRTVSTYHGDLLAGAMLFNKRFTAKWAEDGYRDYLSAADEEKETGKTVLTRLLRSGDGLSMRAPTSGSRAPAAASSSSAAAGSGSGAGAGSGSGAAAGVRPPPLPPSFEEDARRFGASGVRRGGPPSSGMQDKYLSPPPGDVKTPL